MQPLAITLYYQKQAHVVYELYWHSQLNDDYLIEVTLHKEAVKHPKNQMLAIHLQDKLGPEQWLQGKVTDTRAHAYTDWIILVMHSACWLMRENMRNGVYYDATAQEVIAHNQQLPLPLIDRTQAGQDNLTRHKKA